MNDSTSPPTGTDADEALTRMAAYGRKGRTSWAPLVLVVVLLIPLAAAGWVAWRQMVLQGELAALRAANAALEEMGARSTNQFAQVEQRQQELKISVQEQVQEALQQEQAASAAALDAQSGQLAALASELAATRLRLNSMDGGGSPLTEAEVLLRFAQQRLVLARDTATAIELFRAADALLEGIVDPAVVIVRESLARDVAALQALPAVDVAGLFARLSAQAERVTSFAVVSDASAQQFTVTPKSPDTSAPGGWWSGVKQALGEYFVVTRGTGAAVPQLSGSEQFQLRALVQLHIEQAKVALLRGEPQLYQSALDDALAASRRWLRGDEAFMAELATLRDTPIVVEIPATDASLNALRRLTGSNRAVLQDAAPEPVAQ
jgi:uroporphyrin-3 C-methyltransferase